MTHLYARLSGALLLVLLLAVPAQAADVIPATVVDGAVVWTPAGEYAEVAFTLSATNGLEYTRTFGAAEAVRLHPSELGAEPLADGFYAYQLIVTRYLPDTDEPGARTSQTGILEVRDGLAVDSPLLDQVINDDLIVAGSICAGFDCNNGESFGFDTIRLKENNLRIRALDTSNSASFPTNDWQLTFNDSSNGGENKFSIDDIDGGRTPFTIRAGARSHSLYVDSSGRIGIGTSTPSVRTHLRDGNTPTVRLDQDGSSGFTSQVWDMAGNEANFFIRDVTNGSRLVFRIRPGAPTSSIDVGADGRVGIGTASLSRSTARPSGLTRSVILDVDGDLNSNDVYQDAGDKIALFNSDVEVMGRIDVADRINVRGVLRVEGQTTMTDELSIDFPGTTGQVIQVQDGNMTNIMILNAAGDLAIRGAYNMLSDATQKEEVVAADTEAILQGLAGIEIAHWQYIADPDGATHLGPMAQDFAAAFGLGKDETTIATVDSDGVALASIQALYHRNEAAQARIAELEEANAALEARLARLEALLAPSDD